ncbi:MAG: tRNA-dihydrouridine synthase family protein [Opitutales bacterium]|nr:tRNA-dihydrouridine synthase family protein [Opitutales bacterium]
MLPISPQCALPTALAPMQDVTDLPFMTLIGRYGPPDLFFTEYFRVHSQSRLEKHILRSITENPTNVPVFAQMNGESIPDIIRTARELKKHPIAGIDLNMGCPAPKVFKKNCGGGLLREPAKVDQVLGALREEIEGLFTVKMRIGFDSSEHFSTLLELVAKHRVDLLSLHGRTVRGAYHAPVQYPLIAEASRSLPCPVFANGNLTSPGKAFRIQRETGCRGAMIGRHAIRNPWIFRQIREKLKGEPLFQPTLHDVRAYIDDLYAMSGKQGIPDKPRISKLKKYLNFIGESIDPKGQFLYRMRRAHEPEKMFAVCDEFLKDCSDPFPLEPYPGIHARPNTEKPKVSELISPEP